MEQSITAAIAAERINDFRRYAENERLARGLHAENRVPTLAARFVRRLRRPVTATGPAGGTRRADAGPASADRATASARATSSRPGPVV